MASRRKSRQARSAAAPPRRNSPSRRYTWLFPVVLAAATLAAYWPVWHGTPLWDDDAHLTPASLSSWHGLGRIWTDVTATQQYYPITSTAFWVMNRLWGHDPFGYHLVNILLHVTSALVVAAVLRRFSVPGALAAAVAFALHPVHVESVAWITELKNTLSGVFYLAAFAVYLRFDERRDRRSYAIALVLFILALGSKTVTATLPAAILIMLWWRRARLRWREDVLPLIPFFALGLAAGVGTAWLEVTWVGATGESYELSYVERMLLAGRAVWFYAGKLIWPVPVMFVYPRWEISHDVWWQYLFPVSLAVVLAAAWLMRRRTRAPLAAILFFCVTLGPALGFVNVFPFRFSFVADHFQYLASIGILALLAAGLATVARRRWPSLGEPAVALLVGVPLFALTFSSSRPYASAEALYRDTIDKNPNSFLARNNLATLLLNGPEQGWAEAMEHARAAVRVNPSDAGSHDSLGVALQRRGRFEESIAEHQEAIRLRPDLAQAYRNLGIAQARLDRLDEAIASFEASLRIQPDNAQALTNLSQALAARGRVDEAIARARDAVRVRPQSPDLQIALAGTLEMGGALDEAVRAYQEAIRLRPGWGEAYRDMGIALWKLNRRDEALAALQRAEAQLPGDPNVAGPLARMLASMNRPAEAAARLERALATARPPEAVALHNDLGALLMMQGKSAEAAAHFRAALELDPQFEPARANLQKVQHMSRVPPVVTP